MHIVKEWRRFVAAGYSIRSGFASIVFDKCDGVVSENSKAPKAEFILGSVVTIPTRCGEVANRCMTVGFRSGVDARTIRLTSDLRGVGGISVMQFECEGQASSWNVPSRFTKRSRAMPCASNRK